MSYSKARENKFEQWWKKNHHKKTGQVWLCKSAKRIAFAYNLHPSAFDDVRFICKRFFSSEHMRLKKSDAWKLYKLCNPLYTERLKRLQTTAEHLDASKRVGDKDTTQHPLWIGKPAPKQPLSEYLKENRPEKTFAPSAVELLDSITSPKPLKYEDLKYESTYDLGMKILKKIDIIELVEEAVLFGMDNHDLYGDKTKEIVTSAPTSLLFKILEIRGLTDKDIE